MKVVIKHFIFFLCLSPIILMGQQKKTVGSKETTLQKSKPSCPSCEGKGVLETPKVEECKNCKYWASSYRNAVGCHVCKNNLQVWSTYKRSCTFCNGRRVVNNDFSCIINYANDSKSIYLAMEGFEPYITRTQYDTRTSEMKSTLIKYYLSHEVVAYRDGYEYNSNTGGYREIQIKHEGKWICGKNGRSYKIEWNNGAAETFGAFN